MKQIRKNVDYNKRFNDAYRIVGTAGVIVVSLGYAVFAGGDNDAVTAIQNLYKIIAGIVSAIGGIVSLWGLVQVGMSVPSHDTSQRTQGFLALAGGIIMLLAPWILVSILDGTKAASKLPSPE